MKALINNGDYILELGEDARLSSISKSYTFIRVKKGTICDLDLVRAACSGLFDLDDQGTDWRLTIDTNKLTWEE